MTSRRVHRVEGMSPDSLWSVGIDITREGEALAFSPMALHREGARWAETKQPIASGRLDDLAVRGPNDIWAVGHRPDDALWRRPMILHYDRSIWTELATPADTAQLHSIQFVDGQAVVFGENPDTGREPYVLVQKGDAFVHVDGPPGAGSLLDSVLVQGGSGRSGATDRTVTTLRTPMSRSVRSRSLLFPGDCASE